jgi:hypothetical protein
MPKNSERLKEVVNHDTAAAKREDDRTVTVKSPLQPVTIISLAISNHGTFYGLGGDGKVYRLSEHHIWETIQ